MTRLVNSLKVNELKARLRELGLSDSGTKATLSKRLRHEIGNVVDTSPNASFNASPNESSNEMDELKTEIKKLHEQIHNLLLEKGHTSRQGQEQMEIINEMSPVDNLRNMVITGNNVGNNVNRNPTTQVRSSNLSFNNINRLQTPVVNTSNSNQPRYDFPATRQQNRSNQSFQNVRDVIEVLPVFDPFEENSLSSQQFITRINRLNEVYEWEEKILLLAVQAKLKGLAKVWNDGFPTVFRSWTEFSEKLIMDFPTANNEAEAHIEMAKSIRQPSERVDEYFYKMSAKGRLNGMGDTTIIKYVQNGLNHPSLQSALAGMYFSNTTEYITTIQRFLRNQVPKPEARFERRMEYKTRTATTANTNQTSAPFKERQRGEKSCYNCGELGHFSINCLKPQKRIRCTKCNKTGHSEENCFVRVKQLGSAASPNNVRQIGIEKDIQRNITKKIILNKHVTTAFIDIGSERSLISATLANDMKNVISCTTVYLKGFAGGVYSCDQKLIGNLEIDGQVITVELFLVEDHLLPEPVLLGSDVLCRDNKRLVIEFGECHLENTQIHEESVDDLLKDFSDCFAEKMTDLGKCHKIKMSIDLKTDVPINKRPYRIPFAKRERVSKIIGDLLEHKIICPSDSEYSSPIVLVEKQNGEDRLCVDYRELNSITLKQPFPMPIMEELLAQLAGNKFFTTLDFMSGYYQIPIEEKSQKFTAFSTFDGHYEFKCMPFGLVNAPRVFQLMINKLIKQMSGEVIAYLDDVIIPSKTVQEGLDKLKRFLKIIREAGLTLRLDKCRFLAEEIKFLGHRIRDGEIKPGTSKTEAIKEFKPPKNVHEVRRFLGLTGFFRKFIQDYSIITKPITMLLKGNDKKAFEWTQEQNAAFLSIKEKLCTEPVLTLYDPNKKHEVHTDASSIGLAGMLLQEELPNVWKPVFYYSRHCTELESRYHSHELEVLAMVESLERFRIYLIGKPFNVVTDCSAVSATKLKKPLIPRIARWWLKLQEYDFTMEHRSATRIRHVDALSRSPQLSPRMSDTVADKIFKVEISQFDWLATMQHKDEKLLEIMKILRGDLKSDRETQLKKEYVLQKNRLYRRLQDKLKWVVPKAVRWRIVKSCHDDVGHFGKEKTIVRIQEHFWFPRIRKYVNEYIAACIECCFNKKPGGKTEGQLYSGEVIPIPFRVLHIDHLGPFQRTRRGNTYIIAVSDPFTKYVIVKAVKSTKTTPVIELLNELTTYFGLPMRLISDRGTAYTSKTFEEYCGKNGIDHIKTAVRTPRANGQIERVNQMILSYLRTSTEKSNDWDKFLRELQWNLNTQKSSTTGYTANELLFDFELRDLMHNRIIDALHVYDNKPEKSPSNVNDKRQQAVININKERQKWKQRFDSHHKKPTIYAVNDLVVIENVIPATGESRKLEPKYRGPYLVSRVLGKDRYLIEDLEDVQRNQRKFCSVYTAEKLKRWCDLAPDLDEQNDSESEQEEDEYEISPKETETVPCQERPSCQRHKRQHCERGKRQHCQENTERRITRGMKKGNAVYQRANRGRRKEEMRVYSEKPSRTVDCRDVKL